VTAVNVLVLLEHHARWIKYLSFNDIPHEQEISASTDGSGVPCYGFTAVDRINADPSPVIAIDCLMEGYHCNGWFNQYNKDKVYLIFSGAMWNKKCTLDIEYQLIYFSQFVFTVGNLYNNPSHFQFYQETEYDFVYPKPYVFISTVGLSSQNNRLSLINKLNATIPTKNYIIKYAGKDYGMDSSSYEIPSVLRYLEGSTNSCDSIDGVTSMSMALPIKMFNSAYFNLIAETGNGGCNDNFFITEKTIKSLISGMPFVVFSTHRFLENLRKLGFKTFDSIWDENYDCIEDNEERATAIVNLCDSLCNYDWGDIKQKLQEITIHNRLMFMNMNRLYSIQFNNMEQVIRLFKKIDKYSFKITY